MSFTPGPWRIEDPLTDALAIMAPDRPGYTNEYRWIASVSTDKETGILFQEAEANARLIAAAPDMYAALQEAVRELRIWIDNARDDDDDAIPIGDAILARAAAAIAKANGWTDVSEAPR